MRVLTGLEQLADVFLEMAVAAPIAVQTAKEAAAQVVKEKVVSIYGDDSKLAQISADSTAIMRGDGGSGGPLLMDGKLLRDSVRIEHINAEAVDIGSDEPISVYHELGYVTAANSMIPGKTVPARPVFHIALAESEDLIEAILGETLEAAFVKIIGA